MNIYQWVLYTHITSALLSFSFFTLRGYWMLKESDLLQAKIVRVLPHIIDTILLAAGITLSILIQQYPGYDHWLSVKIIALLVYILLGTIALKRGKTMRQRTLALILSWATFGFIVSVAISHNPRGIFGLS